MPRISRNSHPRRVKNFPPSIALFRFHFARRLEEGRNSRKVEFFDKSESYREKERVSSTRQTGNRTASTRVLGEICVEEPKQKNIRMKNRDKDRGRERERKERHSLYSFQRELSPILGLNSDGGENSYFVFRVCRRCVWDTFVRHYWKLQPTE